jgi:hypothetical protein
LGTVAANRTGSSSAPAHLTAGYGLGLTISAGLLLGAVVIALTVLPSVRPTPSPAPIETPEPGLDEPVAV